MSTSTKRKELLDNVIKEVLENAPQIRGYTIKELAEKINKPWPTTRWHLELMEARGEVSHQEIGRAKLYFLKTRIHNRKPGE